VVLSLSYCDRKNFAQCSTWNITAITRHLRRDRDGPNSLVHSDSIRRYNVLVASPMHKTISAHGRTRHHVYALESTGLLIIAATLLAITLARYWYAIQWSWR
jgi:hypothetical protein